MRRRNQILFSMTIIVTMAIWGRYVVSQRFALINSQEKTITVDDRSRSYLVFAPENIKGKLPLVFVLHGGGGNSRQMERYSGFNKLAKKEGFLVCYPQGYKNNWNDGREADIIVAQKENVDDIKFFRQMIKQIDNDFNLDRSRIFSTGISNGAFMSHRLAADASELITGIAPMVGGIAEPVAKRFAPKHPVSLFVIQGDCDPLIPFDGGEVGFKNGRKRGKFISTTNAVQKYVELNKIQKKPIISIMKDVDPNDGTTTQMTIYPAGKDGFQVQLYVVKNGGHCWPGRKAYAPEAMIGKTSQDFIATEEIWKFFKSCPPRKQ